MTTEEYLKRRIEALKREISNKLNELNEVQADLDKLEGKRGNGKSK